MSEVIVRNNNKYLEAIKCTDGNVYYIQPKSTITLPAEFEALPQGVVAVKAATNTKK
jgi:hypothetical protein